MIKFLEKIFGCFHIFTDWVGERKLIFLNDESGERRVIFVKARHCTKCMKIELLYQRIGGEND